MPRRNVVIVRQNQFFLQMGLIIIVESAERQNDAFNRKIGGREMSEVYWLILGVGYGLGIAAIIFGIWLGYKVNTQERKQ